MTPAFALKQQKRRGFVVNDQSGRIIVTWTFSFLTSSA